LAGKLRPLQSSTFQDGLFVEFVAEACILLIKNEMKLFLANFVRSLSHVPLRYACLTTAVKITRILNRIQEARRKIGNNMPLAFPSALSVSRFDGRKLLVIMIIVAVTLTVESQISTIADFIPEQLSSSQGIVAFIVIWTIFTVTLYYILAFVKHNNKYSCPLIFKTNIPSFSRLVSHIASLKD
jgi:hypothetical protein